MSNPPKPPDVIPFYRVQEGALLSGSGSYLARLPSGRVQTVEIQSPTFCTRALYYSTDLREAAQAPGKCPICDGITLCDCADALSNDLGNSRQAAVQLCDVLDEIKELHPSGCDPDSGSLICETCRQPYPCATTAAIQDIEEPAARLLWTGEWP